ncbi:putative Pentatricopeptide repeat-containing protein, mitochondrial [Cocos nucifera]|uniref:Putative Pentatricopeptide repeat-containing protein, mitochondrial n=1 Tax=Cocos nucifera TaxID=13894 RepID=A0A8K0IR16_COCNU|nr:putative Pentatricopeptide repeat-containing protein, mitochondrial [Cocos nucifera]
MASKIPTFVLSKRLPIQSSLNALRFYSIPSAACVQNPPVTDSSAPNSAEFESATRSLRNRLHPDRLIRVLDSTLDLNLAVNIFKWASIQKKFQPTLEIYTHIILKLGLAGNHQEMGDLLKEMVKLDLPNLEEALGFMIHSFCRNHRLTEALKVFEHANSVKRILSVSSCNALLGTFVSKRGNFQSVMFVYKEMVKAGILPDVETLNYLIKALCESGHLELALNQFHRMSEKQCAPNSQTFEILINALCSSGRVDESVKFLNQMLDLGCKPQRNFYVSIIPLFCRINGFQEGIKLFRMMKNTGLQLEAHLYGILVLCLCENQQLDDAVELFEDMLASGFSPVNSMHVDIVNGYCKMGKLCKATSFLDGNNTLEIEPYNALLKGFCDQGRFLEAINYLRKMADQGLTDSMSWNIIIRGLCEHENVGKAFEVIGRMIVSSYMPEQATYSAIIIGYCKMGSCEKALEMFRMACVNNMTLDSESCSELIEGLCYVKQVQEAMEVSYYITNKGLSLTTNSLNMLIQENCHAGKVHEAIRLRSLAVHKGTYCIPDIYTTILLALLDLNKEKDILAFLSQMLVEGYTLDARIYCILICGLCTDSTMSVAALLFNQMIHDGFIPDSKTFETLVFSMAKFSQLHMVVHSLEKIINENRILSPTVCNMIIHGLLKEGHRHEACKFLDRIIEMGWVPDAETHGLLVGSFNIQERDGTIRVSEASGNDNKLQKESACHRDCPYPLYHHGRPFMVLRQGKGLLNVRRVLFNGNGYLCRREAHQGPYTQKKRKGKASGESSKWAKVGISNSVAPAATDVAPKVRPGDEVVSTARADVVEGEPLPPESTNLPFGDYVPNPSAGKEEGRKGKATVAMKACKERLDEPDRSNNEDQGADPFGNLDIIRDLTNRFALPEESGHHILAHLKKANRLEAKVLKVREDLQAEINRLRAMAAEAECLVEEKTVENKSLRSALRKEEFISVGLKAALALEEEEKKEARLKPEGVH